MEIIIGEPIDMSDLYEQEESRQVYQAIADRMVEGFGNFDGNCMRMGTV